MTSLPIVLVVVAMMTTMAVVVTGAMQFNCTNNCLSKQDLQTIAAMIEEQFRVHDRTSGQQRLENVFRTLDDRLRGFERKLERFSQSANAAGIGDHQHKKEASRKIDLMYERVDHRIGFVEAKLYTSFINLQLSSEKLIKRIEKLERSFETKQNDVEHELSLVVGTATDEIRAQFSNERFANITNEIVQATVDKLSSLLTDNDKEQPPRQRTKTAGLETTSYFDDSNEMTNSNTKNKNQMIDYEETVWRLFENIQNTLKITMSLQNLTRREQQDNYKSLLHQFSRITSFQHSKIQSNSSVTNTIDLIVNRIEQKLNELRTRHDSKLHEIVFNQKLFMENCHRIQIEEQQLDSKIGLVLERLLDMFINNTSGHRFEFKQIQSTLESHDYQVKDLLNEGLKKILEKLLNESTTTTTTAAAAVTNNRAHNPLLGYIQKQLHDLRSKVGQIDSELASVTAQSPFPTNTRHKLKEVLATVTKLNRQIIETAAKSKPDDDYEMGGDGGDGGDDDDDNNDYNH